MNFSLALWPIFIFIIATKCESEEPDCNSDGECCEESVFKMLLDEPFFNQPEKAYVPTPDPFKEFTILKFSEAIRKNNFIKDRKILDKGSSSEYTHMAALYFYNPNRDNYVVGCAGSLIASAFVLTSAYCVQNPSQMKVSFVRLGATSVPYEVDEMDVNFDVHVKKAIVHEEYDPQKVLNDIALLELEDDIVFYVNVRPIWFFTMDNDPFEMMALGWINAKIDGKESALIQKVTRTLLPRRPCKKFYGLEFDLNIETSHICAQNYHKIPCEGDSGGPLQVKVFNTWYIVGVAAAGGMCGRDVPGIYTRIESFEPWINKIVWPYL